MSAALRDRPSVTNRIVQSSSPGPRASRPIGRMLGRPAAVEVAMWRRRAAPARPGHRGRRDGARRQSPSRAPATVHPCRRCDMLRRRRSERRSPVSPRLILPAFGCSGGTSFAGSSWHRRWARGGSARGRTRQGVRVAVVPREGTKIHDVIKMLSRDGGATIDCCDGLAIAYHPRGAHWPSQTWVCHRTIAERRRRVLRLPLDAAEPAGSLNTEDAADRPQETTRGKRWRR